VKKRLLLLLAAAAVAAAAMPDALHGLKRARQDLADVQALSKQPVRQPPPLMADGGTIVATDRAAAARRLVDRLQATAGRRGVLVEEASFLPADPAAPSLLRVRLTATGGERALIRYVNELERSEWPVRFTTWQLAPRLRDAALQLQSEAVTVWTAA